MLAFLLVGVLIDEISDLCVPIISNPIRDRSLEQQCDHLSLKLALLKEGFPSLVSPDLKGFHQLGLHDVSQLHEEDCLADGPADVIPEQRLLDVFTEDLLDVLFREEEALRLEWISNVHQMKVTFSTARTVLL